MVAVFALSAARLALGRVLTMMIATHIAAIEIPKLRSAFSRKNKITEIARAITASTTAIFIRRRRAARLQTKPLVTSSRVMNAGTGPGAEIAVIWDQTVERQNPELAAGQSSCRNSMRALSFSMWHQGQLASCL